MKMFVYFLLSVLICTTTLHAQTPLKSLTIGNKFIYGNGQSSYVRGDALRYIETVLRDTLIGTTRYGVVHSTYDNSTRLERSDANTIYVYRNGREEIVHSWNSKVGDSIGINIFGFGCASCRYPISILNKRYESQYILDTIFSLEIKRSTLPAPLGEKPIYIGSRRIYGVNDLEIGPMGIGTWRKVFLQGAIIDGKVYSDTTSTIVIVNVQDQAAQTIAQRSIQTQAPPSTLQGVASLRTLAPNPFSASVTIEYDLFQAAATEAVVYSTDGLRITTLKREQEPSGNHSVQWNGKSATGEIAANGAYLISFFINNELLGTVKVVKQ
jgi:hypothetical protein